MRRLFRLRFRLLPVVIAVAVAAFAAKVPSVWSEARAFFGPFAVSEALAQVAPTDEDPFADSEAAEDEAAGGAAAGDAAAGSDPSDDAALGAPSEGGAQPAAPVGSAIYTEAELQLLQDLSARREELDQRARELDIRENLLQAAEQRIEDKIAELRGIEARIDALIQRHDEQEERKLRSLVNVYETMKPKDAARIFNELDLDILLDIAEMMNERRLAPILAEMDPQRATTVTTEIRTRKELPATLVEGTPAAAAPEQAAAGQEG